MAEVLGAGDVVSLTGDLGAGKTTFVQGATGALGVRQPALSPTFTLVREYEGAWPIYHVDVYRLDRIQEVTDLGFEEMLGGDGIVFVEWGDAIQSLLPDDHLQIELTIPAGEAAGPIGGSARRLRLLARGESWSRRWGRLAQLTDPWRWP